MAFLHRIAHASRAPILCSVALLANNYRFEHEKRRARCETAPQPSASSSSNADSSVSTCTISAATDKLQQPEGMQPDAGDALFEGIFPLRQLWVPARPYPLWNPQWDGLHPLPSSGGHGDHTDRAEMRRIRKTGTTRHLILVRHGQYDETYKEDEKRVLTELGRQQAHVTGERIAAMMKGGDDGLFGPCKVKALRVSGMTRARETAAIIASHLDGIEVEEPDPRMNEGRPCHTIPGTPVSEKTIAVTDDNHERIESAFRSIFHRAPPPPLPTEDEEQPKGEHEFEVIVCHANVIRYWMCRALQLPPETWLRYCPFNCSLTYVTIRPTGSVSCRMMGDIGHLPYELQTFSGHHGFNW